METKQAKTKANNTVNLLNIRRDGNGIWSFDDKDLGIIGEVFVGEINTMIDMYAKGKKKITVFISSSEIPSYTISLTRIAGEFEGMYQLDGTEIEGWLCPCLLNYFPEYVEKIYVQFKY